MPHRIIALAQALGNRLRAFLAARSVEQRYLAEALDVADLERRIRRLIRWNAAVMVSNANRPGLGVGGPEPGFGVAVTVTVAPGLTSPETV